MLRYDTSSLLQSLCKASFFTAAIWLNVLCYLPIEDMFFLYLIPHSVIASITGCRLYPVSVNVYSTCGGTSAKTLRVKRPLSSIERKFDVSTFWLTLPILFFSSPKRFVPSIKSLKINTFHLSLVKSNVFCSGRNQRTVYMYKG